MHADSWENYVMGGYIPQSTTSLVEEYDPKTDTWTKKANMPTVRSEFSVGVVDGRIYAMVWTNFHYLPVRKRRDWKDAVGEFM